MNNDEHSQSREDMKKLSTSSTLSPSPMLISLGIILLTFVVYIQVLDHDFINMDDTFMVVDNPHIRDGMTWKSIQWAFTAGLTQQSPNIDYWRPVTVVSQLVDVQFYGLNPAGHHFTNLVLHAANAVLLFLLLLRLTGQSGPSGFVAAVFAVHPVHIASVAWVAERKDVLCLFWGLLAIHAYVSYWKSYRPGALLASVIAFALGLMSKPMLVTLPFLLLLLSWWPLNILRPSPDHRTKACRTGKPAAIFRQNLSHVLRVLTPFAALSVASAAATYVSMPTALSISDRSLQFSNVIASYGTYLLRAFWPAQLSCYYSFPLSPYPVYETASIFFLLASVSCYVVLVSRTRPWLVVGWFWYLVALLPVIASINEATANRFTYIPLIGIYIAVAWTGRDLMKRFARLRKPFFIAVAVILLLLTESAWQETAYWKNSFILFERALAVTTGNYFVHRNLGITYMRAGDLIQAERHLRESVRINPDYASGHFNLAIVLGRMGRTDEAIKEYEEILQHEPMSASAHNNVAGLEMERGAFEAALEHYSRAIELVPDKASYRAGRAVVLMKMNRIPEAVRNLADALERDPSDPTSRNNMRAIIGNLIIRARSEGRLEELRRDIHDWTSCTGSSGDADGGAAWKEASSDFDQLAHE